MVVMIMKTELHTVFTVSVVGCGGAVYNEKVVEKQAVTTCQREVTPK
jgi:hypothetical protein